MKIGNFDELFLLVMGDLLFMGSLCKMDFYFRLMVSAVVVFLGYMIGLPRIFCVGCNLSFRSFFVGILNPYLF